jgi:branched-chain amino acid transport system permease protein
MSGVFSFVVFFLTLVCIYGIFAIATNLSWGGAGLFNFSLHGMILIGAYTSAILTGPAAAGRLGGFGLPFVVGLLGAMLATGLASLVFIPFLWKLRDPNYFALGCLGFAEIVRLIATQEVGLTNGPMGLEAPDPGRGIVESLAAYDVLYLVLVAVILAAVLFLVERVQETPWGRVLRTIREDEDVALSLGKPTFAYKMQVTAVTSMLLGLGGALLAHFYNYITPENFQPLHTFVIWIMLIAGGIGNNYGMIVGAVLIRLLWEGTVIAVDYLPAAMATRIGDIRLLLIGLTLILIMLWRPRGLFPESKRVSRYLDRFAGSGAAGAGAPAGGRGEGGTR